MRVIVCAGLVLIATSLRAGAPAAATPEEEQKRFQGAWQLSAVEQNGINLTKDVLAEAKWVFEAEESTLEFRTNVRKSKLKLDPSTNPQHIDLVVTAGPDKGNTYRGIYKFVDDELILCLPVHTKVERPKGFSGNAGPQQALYVLKKKKA
jgi:uncharacterized protein (TIGR03067 family)